MRILKGKELQNISNETEKMTIWQLWVKALPGWNSLQCREKSGYSSSTWLAQSPGKALNSIKWSWSTQSRMLHARPVPVFLELSLAPKEHNQKVTISPNISRMRPFVVFLIVLWTKGRSVQTQFQLSKSLSPIDIHEWVTALQLGHWEFGVIITKLAIITSLSIKDGLGRWALPGGHGDMPWWGS